MDERQEQKRRKRERSIVIFLFLFIVLFTGIEIYLLQLSAKLPFVNSIFFFGLMNLNIVLIMLLLFLVFRNVVKLILDERKGRVGSRLKTRLVFSFILFAIIPTILLFSISAIYIRNSFDKWFNIKIGGTLQKSIDVVRDYYENTEKNASHFARKIAFSLENPDRKSDVEIQQFLDRVRLEYGLDAAEYYRDPLSLPVTSIHPKHLDHIPRASLETLRNYFDGENDCRVQNVGAGELLRCGAFLGVGKGVLFASYFISTSLASQLSEITLTYQDYKANSPLNYPIKSTYFAILSMMTLLILFAATWTGFYVAKRLAVPIEDLAKGTEEVSRGNLEYRIPTERSDEMGRLVESFNAMTSQLLENKDQIERTHGDLKRINLELNHRRRYIEVLLESVQSGVVSLDEGGKISTVNPAATDLLGIPHEKLIGQHYTAIVPEGQREEFREMLNSVYGKAKPVRHELRFRNAGNENVAVLVTLSVLHDEENKSLKGVVAVFDDVTEIQKMQRMIAWREVAKRIAHEIKNPLTPIQLSVQRLRRRYVDKIQDDGTFNQATEIILKEVEAIKKLVSEFSSFARLPEIRQKPGNLNHIVLEAVNLFRSAHETISFDLKLTELLPEMNLDEAQLKRVLINLFDNAVAAMKGEGTIGVSTERDQTAGLTRLTVRDGGSGIPEEVRLQLFEPYFSTKEGGTGLGLAIVQRIISDHGGFVRILPNFPVGTQFVIEFTDSLIVPSEGKKKNMAYMHKEERAT